MSRFYDITVLSKDNSTDLHLEELLAPRIKHVWAAHLYRLALALDPKLRPLKGMDVLNALKERFAALGAKATGAHIYSTLQSPYGFIFKKEKKLVAQVLARIKSGQFNMEDLLVKDDASIEHSFWVCQNLCAYFHPEFPGLSRVRTTLQITSRVLPEGALPSNYVQIERLPQFASRILRDKDGPENPWIAAYGLDAMAKATWKGENIDLAFVERVDTKRCRLIILCGPSWVAHLAVGDAFSSAG